MAKNPRLIDITGLRFARWAVIRQAGNAKGGGALWLCRCDCGVERAVLGADLRKGKSISCGCYKAEVAGARHRTHGRSSSRLYTIWKGMRARCANGDDAAYGGRGITVCDEWNDFSAFEAWSKDSGYADGLTIERVDVDGGYSADNCTWIPHPQQAINRTIVMRAPDGELWWHKAKRNGISNSAFRWRVWKNWPMEDAVSWPMNTKRRTARRGPDGTFMAD